MRNTSENSSRVSRSIAAVALLALMVAGTINFAPRLWKHVPTSMPAANSLKVSAPPPAIHQNASTETSPTVAVKSAPPVVRKSAAKETRAASLSAALQQIPLAPSPTNLSKFESKKKALGIDEFRMGPDTGSGEEKGGETGEDPKLRADYFYRQRAYPFDQTPAGALQQSRQQLEQMIAQQRAMGILPEENAAVPNAVSFPGPANWTNLGPQPVTNSAGGANFGNPAATGRVTAIAVDPTTTNTASQVVYLGAATGGVWKSTDGGSSWNTIFDQNNSLAIGGIAIAPSSNTTIYVGTGELNFSGDSYYGAGVYKSTDGGTNWTQQCGGASVNFCAPTSSGGFSGGSQAGGFFVGDIAVNPTNANIALAAARDAGNGALSGIYRTTDGGANWTLIASASGAPGDSIVWNPSDSTVVYATLGASFNAAAAGVYKSTDSGVTFTKLTGSLPNLPTLNLGRHVLAVAPSNGNVVYVSIDDTSTNSLLGLAKSTDGGATWTFTSPSSLPALPNFCSGQCWYDMAIAVLPNDPNTVVVGGSAFTNNSSTDFRSSDGGATWTDITTGSTAVRPHVDTHVMRFAATTSGFRLYTGNDGGVWFTDNPTAAPGTLTWQPGNNANLTITQFYPGHAVHPSDENISFGGTQDNGTEKYSGVLAWDHVTCGDGAWAAIDPAFPTTVYANCQFISLLRSDFDGTAGTWFGITNQIPTAGERSLFIPPFVQDQNQSGRLYFGTFRVWQSMNYGNNWSAISPDLTTSSSNEVTSVSVSSALNSVVYATTTDGRVWRTTDAQDGTGSTWTNLTKAPLPGRYATMVRTDHGNADIAYVSYSGFSGFVDAVGHIFKTIDGGNTWTDISGVGGGALPNTPVNDIAVVHLGNPLNFDAVFIATDVGVFECANPTAVTPCQTWTPVGTGLPKVPVVGLAYRENSATLRAITHGRGVWVIETPGISAAGLLLLTSITPSSKASGSGAFTMTFDGNDFGQPSGTPTVLVDGADPGVTNINVINANHMTATIPASVTATPGLHQISISQPGHVATPSNPTGGITFSVTATAPTLTSISPTSIAAGSASFPLTTTGTNFVCAGAPTGSVVQFGSTTLVPTTCSSTSMTVTVPSNLVAISTLVSVRVFNAGPGGGVTGTQTFTVGTAATNDNFISAINITSVPFTNSQITTSATTEAGEPIPSAACTTGESASTHSIWYKYTPSVSGNANFTTVGESFDGVLQVVTGTLGAFTPVLNGCNDANVGVPENVTVAVTGGTTYFIMVSDWAGIGGTAVLNLVSGPAPSGGSTPDMTVVGSHTGNFTEGQTGAFYTITVTNGGTGPTTGTVTVVDTLPSQFQGTTTAMTGTGWTCVLGTRSCTRSDALAGGSSYPAVTLTFNVPNNTPASVSNTVTVSGGGETNTANDTSTDPTTVVLVPDMTVAVTNANPIRQGDPAATYTITVTNSGGTATTAAVSVVGSASVGQTFVSMTGTGWTCTNATQTCTRSDVLGAAASYPVVTMTVSVSNTAIGNVAGLATVSGGGETNTSNDTGGDFLTVTTSPDLVVTSSHTGTFAQGQTGATYSLSVQDGGLASTSGTVTVVDTLPASLTATAMTGTGWSCVLATLTCTRSDVLAGSLLYPAITLTVNVSASAPASVTNTVAVSGGGEFNTANDTGIDPTTVTVSSLADMTIAKTHVGNFTQNQPGTYTITASNSGTGPTSGLVTVVDALPTGMTASTIAGTGWTCVLATLTCTRSDALTNGSSYPAITLTVLVAGNAAASLTNTVTVSGGGEINSTNDSASDVTTILAASDLTITKTHVGNFTSGQVGAIYTITVTNSGTGGATLGTVSTTDAAPAGLTITAIAGTGWTCTLGTATCTRNDALAAGNSYPPITVTVNVGTSTPPTLTNNAGVSGGSEVNASNDSANDVTTINPVANLIISKSHTGTFTQGQTGATFSIFVVNNNALAATSGTITVVDTLPVGLTASAISGSGWSCVLGTLTCTRSDVIPANTALPTITVTVSVANNASGVLTNTATVAGGGEVITNDDTAIDNVAIVPAADLTILKSHVGSFSQGQTGATYTLTVSNPGGGPTSGTVTVVDSLPAGLTAAAMSGTGWSCTFTTGTCTRSDVLAAGGSYPAITLVVNVSLTTAASVTNTATVSGGGELNLANDSASDVTTVTPAVSDLVIAKSHVGSFTQGQVGATYSITVSNNGAVATTASVTVVDALPAGLTATALAGTGWTCTVGTLTCTRADALATASSYPPITLTVTVANNAAASITNSVTVSGGGETNVANDTATDPTTIIQLADMTITKSHTGNFVQGQVGATYTITATNSGPGPTSGTVSVVDTVPTGLTATAITGTGWTCTLGTLTCTRADVLAAAASYPAITLTVTVANNAAASITNTATVSGGGELNAANDTANDVTTVTLASDLTITKSHTGNFTQGQVGATYSITVSNAGPGPTNGLVTVVDTLPTGLTATAMAGTGWTCTVATATCTRSDALAVSASYPAITLTVTVANNAAASITNTAVVSGGGELVTANDTATDPTTIILVADMTITKSHVGGFTQGQVGATYTVTVSNGGGGPTVGTVTVVDTLPAALTATAITGTGWTCTLGTLTCTRTDALAAAGSYPAITLTVNVANNAAATVTNTATVSGGGELNVANDSSADPTTIIQLADMTITKSHTGSFVQGQVGATYTITASNSGTGPTTGIVTVADVLPASLTATAMVGTGWTCNVVTVSCTRADALAAAGSYPAITLTVTVAGNAPASVTNSVTVSGGGEINVANDAANDVTTVLTPAAASLSVNTLSFANQGVSTTSTAKSITVTNTGGATLTFTAAPAITSTNAANFAVAAGTTCTNGANVVGGGNCIINITFTPPSVGSFGPATLTLTDNASPTTQTATLTGTGIDFTENGPGAAVTVTAGQTANFTITLTPGANGFANAVTFTASGLPAASTGTFNPTSLTPGASSASTVFSVATTMRGSTFPGLTTPAAKPWTVRPLALWSFAFAAILLALITFGRTGRRRRLTPAMFVTVALLLAIGVTGCSSAASGTPAGTSTITVTATSGSLVHTTTVTLTVQ